jgi:photosystem II stability/assembly factor-like uncharacterized protein
MTDGQGLRRAIGILLPIAFVVLLAVAVGSLYLPRIQSQGVITWKQTGGPSGGKINTLLIDGQNPSVIHAGADGGIYTSRDGGATWHHTSEGLPGWQVVGALAMEPTASNARSIYAGTFAGVYRSTDGGRTWSQANTGLTISMVLSIAVDPVSTSTVYAGTDGRVFKSVDGGDSWDTSSEGLPETTIWSLVVDYATPSVVYAGADSGVYMSTDGGHQWQNASDGMPDGLRVQVLAIDPQLPSTLYAATEAGVYRSTDSGVTWESATSGIGKNCVHALVVDPSNTNILYAAVGSQGVWQSTNSGETWEPTIGSIDELVLTLAIHPLNSRVMCAGTGRGVYYSSTAGQRWEPRNEGLTNANALLLAAVPGLSGHLYTSTGLDVHKTMDDGETWFPINEGLVRPNVRALAVDPRSPDTLYVGTWNSEVYQSVNGGRTWRLMNGGLARDAPISALVVQRTAEDYDSQTPGVLYAGTNGAGVFSSIDGGTHWTAVNNGLEDVHVQVLGLDLTEGGILYAGTGRGMYRLQLGGDLLWQPAQQGLPPDEVRSIVVDEGSPNVIYAAITAGTGEIYRSPDRGGTWTAIGSGSLPTNIKIQALALNSLNAKRSILYAATDGGVFRSEDGGLDWRAINDGLPSGANVLALLVDSKRSYVHASISNSGIYTSVDTGVSFIPGPLVTRALVPMIAVVTTLFVGRWLLDSSERIQDRILERNWPLWRERMEHILHDRNEVSFDALADVPKALRLRALRRYVQEHRDDNLVLRLDPPVLQPANSLQLWDFSRNWNAAQKRLNDTAAFRPVVSRMADQLCQLLGFTLLDSRSYGKLHGYVIKAPALRLRMPPMFPIVFLQKHGLAEQDISNLRDLMDILNVPSYLALLAIPDDGTSAGQERGLRMTRFERLQRGAAHDFVVMDYHDLYRIFVAKDPEKRFIRMLLEQVDLTVVSPYVTAGPVPENMFFGRDYELKTITRTIKNKNFAVVGGRKIGKTSILTKLHRSFADSTDSYSLYLDCQAVQNYHDFCDATETMWKLSWLDHSPEHLVQLVARIKQEREGQLTVFLLDEVDALLEYDSMNQERLFKVFRGLSQEGCCRFVFCGGRVLHASLQDASSALFNFCHVIRLSYLNPRDTGRVVLEPMQEMGVSLEDAGSLIHRIVDLSACHPNLVQHICQQLIVQINSRGDRLISAADLDTIEGSSQFSECFVKVMWGDGTALERLITLLMLDKASFTPAQIETALREQGLEVSSATTEQALDGLVLCSILNKEEQEYYFTAPAFPLVVTVTQDVESLIERTTQNLHNEAAVA